MNVFFEDVFMPRALGLVRLTSFAVLSGFLVGCSGSKGPPPSPPPPKVTVVKPETAEVQKYLEYNGYLDAIESVEVKARVKGILNDVKFIEGNEVTAGTPLYAIDQREYLTSLSRTKAELEEKKAEILNWQAQIRLAQSDLARLAQAVGASSQTELDKARATLDVNKARLAVAEANRDAAAAAVHTSEIQLGYTEIKAPIDGRINRTLVTRGNLVGQSEPTLLTTIVGVEELYVYFDAPERDLVAYQRESAKTLMPDLTSRTLPIEVGVATEPGFPHFGTIDFRENRVDPGTGTVRIRGRLKNPQVPPNNTRLLYPGLFAKVRVPSGLPQKQLVIPEEALLTGQDGRFVYVIGPNDVVERRNVTVAETVWRSPPRDDKDAPRWTVKNPNPAEAKPGQPSPPSEFPLLSVVAIERGLKPDDRVIVNGIQKVRPGQPAVPELWEFKAP